MAHTFIQAGSPLDDYFKDETGDKLQSLKESYQRPHTPEVGDTTLVDDLCDFDTSASSIDQNEIGWTGVIPNESSSSRSSPAGRLHASLAEDDRTSTDRIDIQMDAFAERFKYRICTSGVMEKDYVPCLGGAPRSRDEPGLLPERLDPALIGSKKDTGLIEWKDSVMNHGLRWWKKGKDRPDILVAGLVLVVATDWVVGWKMLLAILAVFAVIGAGVGILAVQDTPSKSHSPGPAVDQSTPTAKADTHDGNLSSLQNFLDTSASLDSTIDSALSLLQSRPEDTDSLHDLRLAIHRLTENMTDHLGTATSTLMRMVDHKELAILSEMYDIPIGPNNSRARADTDISEGDSQQSIASIKRLSWNSSKPLIPLSLPMGSSASSPARLKADRGHTVHMSLGGLPLEDRFTTLPKRKPRASKRSSWAHEWTAHIAQDLEGGDQETGGPMDHQMSSSDESKDAEVDLPRTPNPRRSLATPRRSSPLSRRDSHSSSNNMPHRHIFPIVPPTPAKHTLLPSPLPHSPIRLDQKRRSLQSMPYFHSDRSDVTSPGRASISGSSDMARAGSLQVSDLQMLRDQSTNGSSPHRSLDYPNGALLSPVKQTLERPVIVRAPSLSPLTLPGLKAACLGVHMKRRKMACCLLGLRFDSDTEYWEEVRRVLGELVAGITAEIGSLDTAQRLAKSELLTTPSTVAQPPWQMTNNRSLASYPDFAPRTSDHALLRQQIEIMQASLHRTWTELEVMRSKLGGSERHGLNSSWSAVRGEFGELIRQWERGKDPVSRLEALGHPSDEIDETTKGNADGGDEAQPLPAFLKAWDDDVEPSSIATDSVRSTSDDTHDTFSSHAHDQGHQHDTQPVNRLMAEVLPPPGQDVVFESTPLPAGIERSKLTREERIKAMKEARENASAAQESSRGAMDLGGDVVGELKSMIGLIRKRKGIEEVEPAPRGIEATQHHLLDPTDRRSELPAGFAEDLKRAFVFPSQTRSVGSQESR